jgi:3,4-dihydroxy-2-butanone 4-phosphate synthase
VKQDNHLSTNQEQILVSKAAAKAERKKAALARLAAKKGGEASTPAAKSKPKASELSAQARKLTAKKAAEVDKRPADQPKRAVVGMSRAERKDITRRGHRFAQELARQGEAERRGIHPSKVKLTKLTDAK